jgi:outer membrane protein assembly factor BamE (lipoprotein component of BamABCDE complex)
MRHLALLTLLLAAAVPAGAQATIDPGMSRAQVVAKLGRPSSEHTAGNVTYLYYANGQEKKYGMSDLVTIENGKVVDAIFRSAARRYSGKSSSPQPVPAEAAIARGKAHAPPARKP